MSASLERIWISHRWHRDRDQRYYEVQLKPDLFGSWVVVRQWGGINRPTGRMQTTPVSNYDDGLRLLAEIEQTRQKRDYRRLQR